MTGWSGGSYGERGECLLAPNPNLMTLDGTNTWVLREPGGARSVALLVAPAQYALLRARLDYPAGGKLSVASRLPQHRRRIRKTQRARISRPSNARSGEQSEAIPNSIVRQHPRVARPTKRKSSSNCNRG